ncbi:MAG TPA: phosphatase PAP2 family protein [Candidatus Tetragenococcus pullicola]|nr:phosphatase PAP2 family protein [Candidatus Tetragenococcus pullicola]
MKNKLFFQYSGSCFLLLFAFLSYLVKFYPSWLTTFDQTITHWVYHLHPGANSFFIWITKFGNPASVILLFLAILFLLVYGKLYTDAFWLSIGFIGISGLLNPLLKAFFMRERPTLEHLVIETSYSFPSGHAVTSMILYGSLLLLIPQFFRSKNLQIFFKVFLGLLIFLIGMSRIYLGVHFPSDIIGGYTLGLSWLLFSYPYYREERLKWKIKGKQN